MPDTESLRVHGSGERWRIEGRWRAADLQLCNDYLGYLADRRYSPASVRAYAFLCRERHNSAYDRHDAALFPDASRCFRKSLTGSTG